MTSSKANSTSLVIDSNVWISAVVFGGTPKAVIDLMIQMSSSIVLSEHISSEVRRKLNQKFPEFLIDFDDLLLGLWPKIRGVALGTVTIDVCRDPEDNRILETAVLGYADYVISGDKALLPLSNYNDIAIVTPTEFINRQQK